MSFDLHKAIGLLFSLYGLILICVGIFSQGVGGRPGNFNIALTWGAVLFLVGIGFLLFARSRARQTHKP